MVCSSTDPKKTQTSNDKLRFQNKIVPPMTTKSACGGTVWCQLKEAIVDNEFISQQFLNLASSFVIVISMVRHWNSPASIM